MAMEGFAPDEARAVHVAVALDRNLLSSFDHLAEACGAQLDIERGGLEMLRHALAAGKVASPAHYAIHFDLLDAIAEENDAAIRSRFALLDKVAPIDGARSLERHVIVLDADAIGADIAALHLRNVDADAARPLELMAPPADRITAAQSQIAKAMTLIRRVAPELGGEAAALARQIVLTADRPDAAYPFYGASTFFAWGAIFFNPLRHAGAYEAAETLVHEAAHTLLTALAVDEPLVSNPRDARYRAPIRSDPRPMEGIYHATFVLARTCLFNRALAASSESTREVRATAADAAARDAAYFADGLATVWAEGEVSALGRALLEGADRFVRGSR